MADSSWIGEGRFRLDQVLGSGASGQVWRAWDTKLRVNVALKEMRPPVAAGPAHEMWLRRLDQEIQTQAQLREHPNVVPIYEVVDDGSAWIVMRLLDESLEDQLNGKPDGRLPERESVLVATSVLRALEAAHAKGIMHRDVKPLNVLLDRSRGQVLLGDFGIARFATDTRVTGQDFVAGTVDYVAPERILGEEGNPASDLFALGAMLYRVTEGTSPFLRDTPKATTAAILGYDPPAPRHAGRLTPLITKLLDKDPANRPTVTQALALLETPPPPQDDSKKLRDETASLIIQRSHAEPLQTRSFTVIIDGAEEGEVADGATADFTVTRGKHTVHVTSGDYKSAGVETVVETSCTLITEPDGGRGTPITGLRLQPPRPPSSPATNNKGSGWAVLCCVIIGIFALLYWKNVSFADYVTDNWHWAGSPWSVAPGECLHDDTQTTSSVGPLVVVPCFSAAADYTLLGFDLNQPTYSTVSNCATDFTAWSAADGGMAVSGQPYGHAGLLLCAMPRKPTG